MNVYLQKANILGVKVSILNYTDLLNQICHQNNIRLIASVNKHFLNHAYTDISFKKKLNKFDLVFSDGIGVNLAIKILTHFKPERTTCPDLLEKFLERINQNEESIFLFGGTAKVMETTVEYISKKYPSIIICGCSPGYDYDNEELIAEINRYNPKYLIVGLGIQKQEIWAIQNREKLTVSKIFVVGGAFRVLAGDRKRGPKIIQDLGLEWVVRLISEPHYLWQRYILGIPLFIFRVFREKFNK